MQYEYSYQDYNLGHHHFYLKEPVLKLIKESVTKHPNSAKILTPKILDIGCGNGSFTNLIADQGYEVVGIEDSESGVKIANDNFPNCKFIAGNIYDLPYNQLANQFDLVISIDVIEHLLYPRELIRAAKKCLKPQGTLIVTTPYHGYLKNLVLALSGKMEQHLNPLWDGGHVKFFSTHNLAKMLEDEGFQNINFQFAGRLPYLWKDMICSSIV